MLMLYFPSFLSSKSSSYFDQELTFPLFEIYPPTCPHLQASFSLGNMGDTLTLWHVALWRQASLTRIKELRVPEGWTLWSELPKEKLPQRELPFMSGLNLNPSETWGAERAFEYFYWETFSKSQTRLIFQLLLPANLVQGNKVFAKCNLERSSGKF